MQSTSGFVSCFISKTYIDLGCKQLKKKELPYKSKNKKIRYTEAEVSFDCRYGQYMAGSSTLVCKNGRWEAKYGRYPYCESISGPLRKE